MYDVVFIGAGPGGYVGAIKAALNGMKCAIVEKSGTFGGTCVSVGCIPTKVLLNTAHLIEDIKRARSIGLDVSDFNLNLKNLMKHKEKIVKGMQRGVSFLLKSKGVDIYEGFGSILDESRVLVKKSDGDVELKTKNIVIATGSLPKDLPHIKFDGKFFLSSDDMLQIDEIPGRVGIIGAGAVGVEFASIYRSFGSDVVIIEMLSHLLPLEDEEISVELEKSFKKRKIKYYTGSKVVEGKVEGDEVILKIEVEGNDILEERFDRVLISTGRKPFLDSLGIENLGINLQRGYISVDENYRTSVESIFAIGDVINTPQLAHVASAEGIYVSNFIAGKNPEKINYNAIPAAVFSIPPVSSAGFRERDLKEKGIHYRVAKFPFMANGKAKIEGKGEGFVKVLSEKDSGKILGMHIIGGDAPEHIFLGVMGINGILDVFNVSRTIFPHPTISESLMEVSHIFDGGGIHI